jgi:hypothetical protein
MMDLVFVLAILAFFFLAISYANYLYKLRGKSSDTSHKKTASR